MRKEIDFSNLNVTFGFLFKLTATRFVEYQFAFKKAQKNCLFSNKMKFYHFSVGLMRYVGRKRGGAHQRARQNVRSSSGRSRENEKQRPLSG